MPTPERLEVRKVMANIKNRVNCENTTIGHIYNEEIARANLSASALALAPSANEASKLMESILWKNFLSIIV
jgi:hypothetical protein